MQKCCFNMIIGLIFITGLLFISGCDSQVIQDDGVLEGVISIGPICPVERIPPDPLCQPTADTYLAYPVGVWTSDGKSKVASINPALDGSFRTKLAPGSYRVILEKNQISIGSSNLPVEVTIISKSNTMLDISIDTGIR